MLDYSSNFNLKTIVIISLFLLSYYCLYAQLPIGYTATQIQNGYTKIGGVVFNEDGTQMFAWEIDGRVFVSNWNGETYIKQETPVLDISDEVGGYGDFGFASFCLDPNFDSNGLVYMFYMVDREHLTSLIDCDDASSIEDCENSPPSVPSPYDPNDNDYEQASISRLTRYQLNIGSSPLIANTATRTVLIGDMPSNGVPSTHLSHAGGTVIFGDDGTLLVSTGDNASFASPDTGSNGTTYYQQAINDGILRPEEDVGAFRSQMITSLCGKILRIDPMTGDGIPSNPFYDSENPQAAKSKVWTLGLRNPFRMSIQKGSGSSDPADGNPGIIYVADVGLGTWEELHIFDKGGLNGGWPLYEGLTPINPFYNSGTTNPDENNELFVDNCIQPTSFVDNNDPTLRRFVHNRPEVVWKHGTTNEARVPWFDGTTPTNPNVGSPDSPTTGIEFRGNTAIAGIYVQGNTLGSSLNGKYLFSDFIRNWINVATLTDGSLNWISDISEFAPLDFGGGIVQMMQNPLDGFLYYVNVFQGNIIRVSFEGPTWIDEPQDLTLSCEAILDPEDEFNNWLSSFSGSVVCGNASLSNDNAGLDLSCSTSVSETVLFTLSDECGNEITKSATFTIEDLISPVWDTQPSDLTVNCDDNYQTEYENWLSSFTGTDNCSSPYILNDAPTMVSCPDEVIVNFELTDECGNVTSAMATFTVESDLSVYDFEYTNVIMNPNPTHGSINFQGLMENSMMEVYNLLGQLQLKVHIDNNKEVELDMSSGLYIVKISSGNKRTIKKLILK